MNRHRLATGLALLAGLLVLAGFRLWYDCLQPERALGRGDRLTAGPYRCVRIIEPLTLLVEGTSPATSRDKSFPVRLAGIRLNHSSNQAVAPAVFLARHVPPGQSLRLEFDRQRFDEDRLPLAYVLVEDRLINALMVSAGLALPDPLPGVSSPLQKQINSAHQGE